MLAAWRGFIVDQQGAELVEYGLLALIVAVGAASAVTLFGGAVNAWFEPVTTAIGALLP